jgi:multiple sugar transport system substrate-binding protein
MKAGIFRSGTIVLVLVAAMVLGACQATPSAPTETAPGQASYGSLVFLSTQFRPVDEAEKMRTSILKDFPGTVEYLPEDDGPFHDRVSAEVKTGSGTVDLLGALHGNFAAMVPHNELMDLSDLRSSMTVQIPDTFWELSQLGTQKTYYIPWTQATYVVVINKKALDYLPQGVDVNALTYENLIDWGKAIKDGTGQAKIGFPAGEKGLLHRFFQGYLIPAYSGGLVTTFGSDEAKEGWKMMQTLWQYVNPQSTTYDFMQEPLLSEDVWIAWDHTARLKDALEARPQDFLAVPSPAGPKGRAFMPVMSGLAIPVTSPHPDAAKALIQYLLRDDIQARILQETGFFPVVSLGQEVQLSEGLKLESDAVAAQGDAPDALPALLPTGLGDQNAAFNKIFWDAFQAIVLNQGDVDSVIGQQKEILAGIIQQTGAPCWEPDPDSAGQPCPVN